MNVPKLRFKGFNDEYKVCKLKNVSEIYDGTHKTPNYVDYGVKFVSVENISNLLSTTKYISEADFDKYKIKPKYNDVFMTRIGDIGTSSVYKSDAKLAFYVSLALLRTKDKDILVPDYLNQYIKSIFFQRELNNRTIHVAFPKKINTGEIGECNLNLCSKEEQLKVANFLSFLDKKIELQTKKIEDLKLFKLCLNNRLFNGNKTIKLKDICECKSSTISLSDIEYDDGIYPIYGADGEIKKINCYQNDKEYLAIIKDGAGVGKTIICNKKSSIISTLNALIPNDIPIYYFNELISKIDFSKYIVGSGIPHIYFKDYSNEKLYLHSEKEKTLINKLFKNTIVKIELEKNKLQLLEALKKGLIQNMFV